MDVYRQAAEIVRIVREGNGTAKALCLRKEVQKKKQTYAVVCETLRHYELLQDVLEVAEFFQYYPNANKEFAMCMAYDVVLGKGVNTNSDTTARAVTQSASYLREAYWKVYKHHHITPRDNDKLDGNETSANGSGSADRMVLPRYARVNTLKIDKDTLVERLRRSSEVRKRQRETGTEPAVSNGNDTPVQTHRRRSILPAFTEDSIIPSLLVFPPGSDLHAHPAVRSGQLVLQDRASCLPACIMLDAVAVEKPWESADGQRPLEYIIDACAAPGNKTTQLAALGAPHVKIMATERDERRAELLSRRVTSLGAADYVNVVHMDFFQLSSEDRNAAEGILLDPSCSASGVVTRVDVALMNHQMNRKHAPQRTGEEGDTELEPEAVGAVNADAQGNEFASNHTRVENLARLQRKLLAHSLLSFDNCRTVVYSTCSVHEEENEAVVRQVLEDERVQARGWQLSNIMPNEWASRGLKKEDDTFPLDYTIRCCPSVDATNGFYVARFDRKC